MQEPAGLVEHAHRAFHETGSDHILDLTNGCELGALARLLKLDFAGEKTPEHL